MTENHDLQCQSNCTLQAPTNERLDSNNINLAFKTLPAKGSSFDITDRNPREKLKGLNCFTNECDTGEVQFMFSHPRRRKRRRNG